MNTRDDMIKIAMGLMDVDIEDEIIKILKENNIPVEEAVDLLENLIYLLKTEGYEHQQQTATQPTTLITPNEGNMGSFSGPWDRIKTMYNVPAEDVE